MRKAITTFYSVIASRDCDLLCYKYICITNRGFIVTISIRAGPGGICRFCHRVNPALAVLFQEGVNTYLSCSMLDICSV